MPGGLPSVDSLSFSVVVATHNRLRLLGRCLESLLAQDYPHPYEVVVVDDGSSDGTEDMIRRDFPQVRYLYQEQRGPAAARNLGLTMSQNEIIAFTDDDCLVATDWLKRLASGYKRHPEVAGVGGYMEAPEELLRSNPFAQYERYISRQVHGVGEEEYLGGFECPAGATNNISYRRQVLEEVGGFDESFPYPAGEDADLKWRICSRGYKLLYVPVKATHLRPYTWESFKAQSLIQGKGRTYFERKYGRNPGRVKIALRLALRFLTLARDLLIFSQKRLALVKFACAFYVCLGQWAAAGEGAR